MQAGLGRKGAGDRGGHGIYTLLYYLVILSTYAHGTTVGHARPAGPVLKLETQKVEIRDCGGDDIRHDLKFHLPCTTRLYLVQ
jgi:hypothetical protein